MNSNIIIMTILVIGIQLIDTSIIKNQEFNILNENYTQIFGTGNRTFKFNKEFSFNSSKTVIIGGVKTKQLKCIKNDELCRKYGYKFIKAKNACYNYGPEHYYCNKLEGDEMLHTEKGTTVFKGAKLTNPGLIFFYRVDCNWIRKDKDYFVPTDCAMKYKFEKKADYDKRNDKPNKQSI